MKLYFSYIKQQLKISMQYRSATLMMVFVNTVSYLGSILALVLLFTTFSNLAGYSLQEVLITTSVSLLVFSFSEFLFRGFDQFDILVYSGSLDHMFLRPRSIFLQVLGYKMEIGKLGRVVMSIAILVWALVTSGIQWNFAKAILLLLMVLSGIVIFLGVFLFSSGINIFTIKGNEFVNIFTNGGREVAGYPLDIFNKAIRNFFTFIIPFASFNYLPLQYLLGNTQANIWVNYLSPIYGMAFVIPAYLFFNWALTKYNSSGT